MGDPAGAAATVQNRVRYNIVLVQQTPGMHDFVLGVVLMHGVKTPPVITTRIELTGTVRRLARNGRLGFHVCVPATVFRPLYHTNTL